MINQQQQSSVSGSSGGGTVGSIGGSSSSGCGPNKICTDGTGTSTQQNGNPSENQNNKSNSNHGVGSNNTSGNVGNGISGQNCNNSSCSGNNNNNPSNNGSGSYGNGGNTGNNGSNNGGNNNSSSNNNANNSNNSNNGNNGGSGGGCGGNNGGNGGPTGCSGNKNRICRDFVRGLCRRKHCRYPHVLSTDSIVFCHDFQNSSCPRVNCKFMHYTLQEEEYYRKFGEFPQDHNIMIENGPPPCKDYLIYGICRHRECYLNSSRLDREVPPPMWNDHSGYRSNGQIPSSLGDYRLSVCEELSAIKRASRDALDGPPGFKRFREEADRIDIMAVIRRFEEEQVMLRRRVEVNEMKIAELRASNEYLIAQNAQLRLNNVQQQCSTVVNPVTVTQTTSQPQTPQVMSAVSIAPVQVQATPIVSIATPQTQLITNSAPPLAIATANTSQGQQLAIAQQNITSLSNTSQPLAPTHAQQILGTSQITLTPSITQGPSMGLTINTSQALAMSNATQPIISYPVMTHSILPH